MLTIDVALGTFVANTSMTGDERIAVSQRDDEKLLVAARRDTDAFEAFYRRHVATVIRFAARRSTSPDEVVDLVAAVWLEVVASIDRFDPQRGKAVPWILGIGANLCASDARRRAREREHYSSRR